MFIAVDGIDGSGKTTLVGQLAEALPQPVYVTKEPTDKSQWGQRLREASIKGRLPRDVELAYFQKDRIFHIENFIQPALNKGETVISDRYIDSTLAFQAETPSEADSLYDELRHKILVPSVSFILCCPVSVGLMRIEQRNGLKSVFENHPALTRAAAIYESRKGPNYHLLDASGSASNTYEQAREVLNSVLGNETLPQFDVFFRKKSVSEECSFSLSQR